VQFPADTPFGDKPIAIKLENLEIVAAGEGDAIQQLGLRVLTHYIRQHPLYSIAGLERGVYVIGMKDQFNIHDLGSHLYHDRVQYIADEMGFVLYDRRVGSGAAERLSVDNFGPYFVEQYMLMEVLSKSEVAGNVLEYYVKHKEQLQQCLERYDEKQGKGFICWRFVMSMSKQDISSRSPHRLPSRGAGGAGEQPTSLALDGS